MFQEQLKKNIDNAGVIVDILSQLGLALLKTPIL